MFNLKLAKPLVVALTACAATCTMGSAVHADEAQDTQALKDQMRLMRQQMDALQKQIDSMSAKQAKPAAPSVAATEGPAKPVEVSEPKFEKFAKGFYGTLDVSFDDATKGIRGLTAYAYPGSGSPPFVSSGPKGTQITGSVGWLGDISTNKSVLGYRGSHKIDGSNFDFIYQIETQPSITSAPGASTSYTAQANTVRARLATGIRLSASPTTIGASSRSARRIRPTSAPPTA